MMFFSIWMFVLPGHGTVELHVSGTCIPLRADGCQLVHGPGSKPPAINIDRPVKPIKNKTK